MSKNQSEAFVWPEFNSDAERIKEYTKRYKDMSIAEAFEHAYGISIGSVRGGANEVPKELNPGDVISLYVLGVDKNHVEFDVANYKTQIVSTVNLHKYNRFKHNLPLDPVKVQIQEVRKDKVLVDPLAPVVNDFLNPILKDKNIQKVVGAPRSIRVKNLQLTKGGFTGRAVLPSVSEFVGEEYTVEVFIPGSQIVLNITSDFEQFIGKDVDAFIINYIAKPGATTLSLIASAKELIKFRGECKLIELFNSWCEESDLWKEYATKELNGKITGVINSSKNCGVFVELPDLEMTGLVSVEPSQLVNYKAGSDVKVKITGFDEEKKFNPITQQKEHVDPYVIEDGCLVRCNLKPVLTFVE